MEEALVRFGLALTLAFLTESMTEYLFSFWVNALVSWMARSWFPEFANAQPLKYVAALVGVYLAWAYKLDLLYEAFHILPTVNLVGVILTGLAVGRGANYLHDLATKYLGLKPQPVE